MNTRILSAGGLLAGLACAAAPAFAASDGAASAAAFNPEISLILQGRYVHAKDIDERHIEGFPAGGHGEEEGHGHGGLTRGFSLDHTELAIGASIDPYFRGFAVFAIASDEVEVEEAWFQTTGLGHGLTVKAGRFLSGIGYSNEQHAHGWDFADQALVYQALFGEHAHYANDGVQARWIAPTPVFLELGLEGGQGSNFPGTERDDNGIGSWAAFARIGGDVGPSHSWRAGVSYLSAEAENREAHAHDVNDVESEVFFSGDSEVWLADLVWKWAPDGNSTHTNLKLQTEYFQRREKGEFGCEDNSADGGACPGISDGYRARQSGWYAQGTYQFHRNWRAGYRYDRLDPGHPRLGALEGILEEAHHRPERHSVMVDYNPSEFSRLRLQYARDDSMEIRDHQYTLQYIVSLGTHGAHRF